MSNVKTEQLAARPVISRSEEKGGRSKIDSVFLNRVTIGDGGRLIDQDTKVSVDDLARLISLCKHGDIEAAETLSSKIAENAMENSDFVDFLVEASRAGKQLVVVSNGIRNVPTSSALLLSNIAEIINVWQMFNERQTMIVDASACITDDSTQTDWQEQPQTPPTIRPGVFANSWVIFVDDIETHRYATRRMKSRLEKIGGAERTFFLFGASLEAKAYKSTGGGIESLVSKSEVGRTRESLKKLLLKPEKLVVTERVLVCVLDPRERNTLPEFLSSLPDATLVKLYKAASNADFITRYNSTYKTTTEMLRRVLKDRGWISDNGTLNRRQQYAVDTELERYQRPHRIVAKTVNTRKDVTGAEASEYSGMKYSNPEDIKSVARKMYESIISDATVRDAIESGQKLVVTASAYGAVPTAAAHITTELVKLLDEDGVNFSQVKIHRRGNLSQSNFGNLTEAERAQAMKERKIELDENDLDIVDGAVVIAIDDLCATGSHERVVNKVLRDAGAKDVIACYYIQLTEKARTNEPEIEEWLNRAQVRTAADILPWTKTDFSGQVLQTNARLIKMILGEGAEEKIGLSAEDKKRGLLEFLSQASDESLLILYRAASSEDAYHQMPAYRQSFLLLEQELQQRKALELDEANQIHGRMAAFGFKLSPDGQFIDLSTGEDRSELAVAYSLMKFGSVEHIRFFANQVAARFIRKVETDAEFRQQLAEIKNRSENLVLFVPGSRNVESSSSYILAEALEQINAFLAISGLPTIIKVNLPRLGSNPANYAQLSQEQRMARPASTKTILPSHDFYQPGIHLIFADDVRITGATADRVRFSAQDNGALSVKELYAIEFDPAQAQEMPEIENKLNMAKVTGNLDESIVYILHQSGFKPVQRLIRLILSEENRDSLLTFLRDKVADEPLKVLVGSALSNDYLDQTKYAPSLQIALLELNRRGLSLYNNG